MVKDRYAVIWGVVGIMIILLSWLIANIIVPPDKIPYLRDVINVVYKEFWSNHFPNIIATFYVAFFGLLISFIFSCIVVYFINMYSFVEYLITPFIVLLKATPIVAFVPVLMILFGSGYLTKIISASIICFFPMIISGVDGMRRTPEALIRMAEIYNAKKSDRFFHLQFAYFIDGILSSLKVSAPLSVVGAIIAEYVIAGNDTGLGVFIASNINPSAIVSRFVAIILSSSVGIMFYLSAYYIYKIYEKGSNINK
jgi:ABC-type nitrate/sulfonate/bicarbonate transport system permease component